MLIGVFLNMILYGVRFLVHVGHICFDFLTRLQVLLVQVCAFNDAENLKA